MRLAVLGTYILINMENRMTLTKQIESIKLRKDLQYLIKYYFYTNEAMAKALNRSPKVLRDFVKLNVIPQDRHFEKMKADIEYIKEQIKMAENYDAAENIKR